MADMRYGDFIKQKRQQQSLTLRKLSDAVGISLPYLSDIENNNRSFSDTEKLNLLVDALKLTDEETNEFYDLLGKARKEISPDLMAYTMDSEVSPYVRMALRKAKQKNITAKDWENIIQTIGEK